MKYAVRPCEQCRKTLPCKRRFCSLTCYHGWLNGRPSTSSTKFRKGITPWNKGSHGLMPTPWNKGRPHLRGPRHPNWRGGTTDLRKLIRNHPAYQRWRTAVFQRDGYRCVTCGRQRRPGDRVVIHADHIRPFALIVRDERITTLDAALRSRSLWDTRNGRTLCAECHVRTPTYRLNQHSLHQLAA